MDRYRGKEAFWKHVVKTFHDYHTKKETMDRCWRLKSAVIKSILDANGRNDYELPHGYVEWKPIVQAITDSSSDDDEPVARQLSFEDAEGVLPCSQAHSPTLPFKSSRARVFLAMCNTVALHRYM